MYLSLGNKKESVSFKEALFKGLASDKSLYYPVEVKKLDDDFWKNFKKMDTFSLAYNVLKGYINSEIPKENLLDIIKKTLDFKFPTVLVDKNIYSLELFHGPTMAFKDVGAKFMSACMDYFIKNQNLNQKITVVVATSGDTGGAVANGFSGTKDIDVCILYPKGKISEVQEKQITTNSSFVQAIEVKGDFDLCQSMVKNAFNDYDINQKISLTSANSINVARWLPQMFYYFLASKKIENTNPNIYSVPSGNFGNICAGILAQSMGLPIEHFVASTNINDTIPRYIKEGIYEPLKTKSTISNAMDVSEPSNFIRIQKIFNNDLQKIRENISGYSFDDKSTMDCIEKLNQHNNYITDPHSAIGYLGLKKYIQENNLNNCNGLFVSTAHPIKFKDTVENSIKSQLEYPDSIKSIMDREKSAKTMKSYSELKEYLMHKD